MSCLEVRITNLSPPLLVGVERLGEGLQANTIPLIEPIKILLGVEEFLNDVIVSPLVEGLKVSCGIVCDIAQLNYLNVSPEDVMWITDSEGIYYSVESNTDWIVE